MIKKKNIPGKKIAQSTVQKHEAYAAETAAAIVSGDTGEGFSQTIEKYRLIVENSGDVVFTINPLWEFTYLSPSVQSILGYEPAALKGKTFMTLFRPDDVKIMQARLKSSIKSKYETPGDEYCLRHASGDWRWLFIKGTPVYNKDGEFMNFTGIAVDVTQRKQAEEALRESEERWQFALEGAGDGIWDWDALTNHVYFSPRWKSMLGYADDEISNTFDEWDSRLHPDDRERTYAALNLHLEGKTPIYMSEHRIICKDGTYKWILDRGKVIKWTPDGKPLRVIGTHADISKLKQAEEALRQSEEKYRLLIEKSITGIYIIQDGKMAYVNPSLARAAGYLPEEMIGKLGVKDLVHPDDVPVVMKRMQNRLQDKQAEDNYVFRALKKDGSIIYLEVYGMPIEYQGRPAVMGTLIDITARRLLDDERQRVARLESLGMLAGGIAHDFNNILTAILGNISLARLEAQVGSDLHDRLEEAERASFRAKDLTRQLLTFSKGGAPVKKLASLPELLRDSTAFALRGSNVNCQFYIADDLWNSEIDEGQISQVINNLVINAQQAMPAGGTIELRADNISPGEIHKLGKNFALQKGRYIRIAITDHGIGIPEEYIDKIFDPFFTTKQKGSGLGLATSFSIIRNHSGHISVESKVGTGSTFYIYLPASKTEVIRKRLKKAGLEPQGKARILVMDDEAAVRDVAMRMLKHIGYEEVEVAADGEEAIKLYTGAMNNGRPFDAVILDITIPGGMGGKETIKKLLEIDPGVRAIVSSGYTVALDFSKYKKYGFKGAVAKPYTLEQMHLALHELIG